MKKIFFCVLMFTIVLRVNASLDVYSSWSDVYPSGIPKSVIQSEERYKWYKEEIIDVEYLKKEDIYNKLVDYNDYKSYESEELFEEPIKINDRIIKSEIKTYNFKESPVDYIVLSNENTTGTLGINEIVVINYKKGEKLKISVDNNYSLAIDDNKETSVELKYKDKLYINLNEEIEPKDIRLYIYYNSSSNKNKLTIEYNAHKEYSIYKKISDLYYCTLAELYLVGINDMSEIDKNYQVKIYKYIDKYYKTYKVKKTYKDEYYASLDGYVKDESTKKIFYRYLKYKKVYYTSKGRSENPEDCKGKSSCIIMLEEIEYPEIPKEKEEIEVPKTLDNFSIGSFIISIFFFISIVVYLIRLKCRNVSYD